MKTVAICLFGAAVAASAVWGHSRRTAAEEQPAAKPPEPAEAVNAEKNAFERLMKSRQMRLGLTTPLVPPLDRNLYLEDLNNVLRASQTLVNKRYPTMGERGAVANLLLRFHHRYCLPALLAVALDEDDDESLRGQCVVALATYPAPLVAEPLIGLVDDPEPRVARLAQKALYRVTGRPFTNKDLHLSPEADSPERKHIQEEWRKWWKEHREEFSEPPTKKK
jgi:hypothetical protein